MGFDDACFRDSEDDMIRTMLDYGHPFLDGITLERLEHEHSVRLSVSPDGEPFLPFAKGGFGTRSGKCEFGADTLDTSRPSSRDWAPPICLALSAGTDFGEDRRQHELDLRQPSG